MIRELNAEPLSFVAHVGDIAEAGRCDDAWLEARKSQFEKIRQPFVLLPGDNEWTDCHRTGFDPLERLAKWRSLFCGRVAEIGLERQAGEYCENARWQVGSVLYVGVNVPGSNNNLGRTPRMDAEHAKRMRAVHAWLAQGFALAEARGLDAVVVLMQANPFESALRRRAGAPDGYESLRKTLGAQGARRAPTLLLVNGDTHTFRDDEPLPGLRRVEVFGAPHVRWLRATAVRGGFLIEPGR